MDLLAKVTLASASNFAEDAVTNQFVFTGPPLSPANVEAVGMAVADFYRAVEPGSGSTLGSTLSNGLSRVVDACDVSIYDLSGHLDGSDVGSPIEVFPFTLPAMRVGAIPAPNEVAYCYTLEGSGIADVEEEVPAGAPGPAGNIRPKSRRRGRIYIGPLTSDWIDPVAQGDVVVDAAHRGIGFGLFAALRDDLLAIANTLRLGVWSRADASIRPVEAISADNRFDTIRSRGARPTVRTRVVL